MVIGVHADGVRNQELTRGVGISIKHALASKGGDVVALAVKLMDGVIAVTVRNVDVALAVQVNIVAVIEVLRRKLRIFKVHHLLIKAKLHTVERLGGEQAIVPAGHKNIRLRIVLFIMAAIILCADGADDLVIHAQLNNLLLHDGGYQDGAFRRHITKVDRAELAFTQAA